MKIQSFSTEQFAGIVDKEISFSDGINVILGNNESGKSTIVNAMYHALTTPVAPKKTTKKPSADFQKSGSFSTNDVDTINAKITLNADGDSYLVNKVWDLSGDETTITVRKNSDPAVRGTQAEEALSSLLDFGTGIYSNLIFGRQNYENDVLDWCYKFFKASSDKDAVAVKEKIKEAFSAAEGISVEKFNEIITNEINAMSGNWDSEWNRPQVRRSGSGRWEKGNGSVLKAYYAYDDAINLCRAAEDNSKNTETINRQVQMLSEQKSSAQKEHDKLLQQKTNISGRADLQKLLKQKSDELNAAESALIKWPEKTELSEKLARLHTEFEEAENRKKKSDIEKKLDKISELTAECDSADKFISQYPDIADDAAELSRAERNIASVIGKLTSAKLCADVNIENGYKAEIRSADGKTVSVDSSAIVNADGYISVVIPGVVSLRVAPQNMNIDELENQKEQNQAIVSRIYEKYAVHSTDEFSVLVNQVKEKAEKLKSAQFNLKMYLNDKSADDVKAEFDAVVIRPEITVSDTIADEINKTLLQVGARSIDVAIGSIDSELRSFTEKYTDISSLSKRIDLLKKDIAEYQNKIAQFTDCPEISESEFDFKIKSLETNIKSCESKINEFNMELGNLMSASYPDTAELEQMVNDAKLNFENEKKKLEQYKRIRDDFCQLASAQDDTYTDFYNSFNSYLKEITDGGISFVSDNKSLDLRSRNNKLNDVKYLSEGTKKTLLLAFRLAVLDYLYPDGNGFVVLDDELIDMDPDRRKNAASLLKKFAENNQVIMTTCDPSIAQLLTDKPILM